MEFDTSDLNSQFAHNYTSDSFNKEYAGVEDLLSEMREGALMRGGFYGNSSTYKVPEYISKKINTDFNLSGGLNKDVDNTVPTPNLDSIDYFKDNTNPWKGEAISVYDTHKELSSGKMITKYDEGYIGEGVDHDNYYGSMMSTGDKWSRGITKAIGKTGLRVAGGTAGFVYGVGQAIHDLSLSSLYDNSFNAILNDYEEELNTNFANYRTKEERNAGLFSQMLTANFWADTALDGVSFVVATGVTESLWAGLTGGASLSASIIRGGLKTLAKKGVKDVSLKMLTKQATNIGKKALRKQLLNSSTAMKALHTTRFAVTSGFYESGQESFHSLLENTESYIDNYTQTYGYPPSLQELQTFKKSATSEANNVFLQNLVVTGAGNAVLLGSHFGIGRGLGRYIDDVGRNIRGNFIKPITKVVDGVEKTVFTVSPTKVQKVLGHTVSSLETVVSEGVQEGLQGSISSTSSAVLDAQFNPMSLNKNLSRYEAYKKGFEEAFTTKEGLTEVLVGGIIGAGGAVSSRIGGAVKGRSSLIGTSYGDRIKSNKQQAERLQKVHDNIVSMSSDPEIARKLLSTNAINSFMEESSKHKSEGNLFQSNVAFKKAVVSHFIEMERSDMMEGNKLDLHSVIDTFESELSKQGLNSDQINTWKQEAKNNIDEWSGDVKSAYEYGKDIGLDAYNKVALNPLDIFVHSTVMGKNSYKEIMSLAKSLSEITGGVTDGDLTLMNSLTEEQKNIIFKHQKTKSEIDNIQKDMVRITQEISDSLAEKQSIEGLDKSGKKSVKKLDQLNEERNSKIQELHKLEEQEKEQRELLDNIANDVNLKKASKSIQELLTGDIQSDEVSHNDVVEAYSRVKKLNDNVKILKNKLDKATKLEERKALRNKINNIERLQSELSATISIFQDYNRTSELMEDPRFMRSQFRGFFKPLKKLGKPFSQEELESHRGAVISKVEAEITKRGKKLSEDDKYTMRAIARMILSQQSDSVGGEPKGISDEAKILITSKNNWFEDKSIIARLSELAHKEDNYEAYNSLFENLLSEDEEFNKKIEQAKDLFNKKYEEILNQKNNSSTIVPSNYEENKQLSKEDLKLNQDIEGFKNQILDLIQRSLGNMYFFDGTKEDLVLPSLDDIAKFIELSNRNDLNEEEQETFESLKDTINNVGLSMGTMTGEDVSLYGLIDIYNSIKNVEELDIHSEDLEDISTAQGVEHIPDNTHNKGKSNTGIAQSYDGVVISRKDKNIVIHNITEQGFFQSLKKVVGDIKISDGANGVKVAKYSYQGQDVELNYFLDEKQNVVITHGNNSDGIQELSDKTPFILPYLTEGTFRNYEQLYILEQGVGIPLKTDIKLGSKGEMINNEAIYDLKEGDLLTLRVDVDSEYNQKLLQEYRDNPTEESKVSLYRKLAVQMVNSKGDIVGVLKGVHLDSSDKVVNKSYEKVREQAIIKVVELQDRLINNSEISNKVLHGIIELEQTAKVKKIFLGFPNVILEESEGFLNLRTYSLSDVDKNSIVDIGYMENGSLKLRNKSFKDDKNSLDLYSMMGKYGKESRVGMPLYNKKISVVVLKAQGRNIAYPVSFSGKTINFAEVIEGIVNKSGEIKTLDQIKQLNKELVKFGLIEEYGSVLSMSKQEIKDMLDEVGDRRISEDKSADVLLDDSMDATDLLRDMKININVENKPFHSPKFAFEFEKNKYEQKKSETKSDVKNKTVITKKSKTGVTRNTRVNGRNKQNEDC